MTGVYLCFGGVLGRFGLQTWLPDPSVFLDHTVTCPVHAWTCFTYIITCGTQIHLVLTATDGLLILLSVFEWILDGAGWTEGRTRLAGESDGNAGD